MAGTLEAPTVGQPNTTEDPKIKTAVETLNNVLGASNKVARAGLESDAKTFTWYTPKVIATEESKTSTSFVTMTTADEIKEVVLPENGLLVVGFSATVKSSTAAAGRIALFIGANQLKNGGGTPAVQEALTGGVEFRKFVSGPAGIVQASATAATADVTTGQTLASTTTGGVCHLFAAAGTYAISVQYKAAEGSVTAKERKLWVATFG